jgi:hypothetical protein
MYCIVVDQDGNEYRAPEAIAKPLPTLKYPSPKPINLNAIVAYLNKPENAEKRKQARLDDANQWAILRSKS